MTAENLKLELVAKSSLHPGTSKRKCVVVVRHAETLNEIYPEWLELCLNDSLQYSPIDLNFPLDLIRRPEGSNGYRFDAPISEVGGIMSRSIGHDLSTAECMGTRVYCSPALKCVQTAANIIRGSGIPDASAEIRIEPMLFDYGGFYDTFPSFISPHHLRRVHQSVDADFKPIMNLKELKMYGTEETKEQYYKRIDQCMRDIIRDNSQCHRIIFVLHAMGVDAMIKSVKRMTPSKVTYRDVVNMDTYFKPLTTFILACNNAALDDWSILVTPIPKLSYLGMSNKANGAYLKRTTVLRKTGPFGREKSKVESVEESHLSEVQVKTFTKAPRGRRREEPTVSVEDNLESERKKKVPKKSEVLKQKGRTAFQEVQEDSEYVNYKPAEKEKKHHAFQDKYDKLTVVAKKTVPKTQKKPTKKAKPKKPNKIYMEMDESEGSSQQKGPR